MIIFLGHARDQRITSLRDERIHERDKVPEKTKKNTTTPNCRKQDQSSLFADDSVI
jgi:hypothetical protein